LLNGNHVLLWTYGRANMRESQSLRNQLICKISSQIGRTRRAGAKGASASQKTLTN
jgi:hypothetical protein